ncbi:MAG TPA: hypothetical protein PLR76_03535 [Hyphomonas sp.]|nr:hypothetical protein [Hyphomonas sp.]MCB9962545.1 hypothetical protein [Hyphomonas sp.]MCB9972003.1 hypothetical protein [Hyphomonas sp.]HPE47436.1 hypothetical protein [Hyphomonas sp.]
MAERFSFDGALLHGFRAAHARTFPWSFALAFALISTGLTSVALFLARGTLFRFFDAAEALEGQPTPADPWQAITSLFGVLAPLVPWLALSSVISWIVWAMFEAASQRRYIRNEAFSLRFGADELRMMATGFLWYLMQLVLFIVPILIIVSSSVGALHSVVDGTLSEREFERLMLQRAAVVFGLMLILLPVYVFFATRLSPCFAMTIKDRRIVFRGAWPVSRGRFWPILGAFLLISIVGGMAVGLISSLAQILLLPVMMGSTFVTDEVPDLRDLFTPAFFFAMAAYMFVRFFMTGLLMHYCDGPAAFAARHDPAGGVDDTEKIATFD